MPHFFSTCRILFTNKLLLRMMRRARRAKRAKGLAPRTRMAAIPGAPELPSRGQCSLCRLFQAPAPGDSVPYADQGTVFLMQIVPELPRVPQESRDRSDVAQFWTLHSTCHLPGRSLTLCIHGNDRHCAARPHLPLHPKGVCVSLLMGGM